MYYRKAPLCSVGGKFGFRFMQELNTFFDLESWEFRVRKNWCWWDDDNLLRRSQFDNICNQAVSTISLHSSIVLSCCIETKFFDSCNTPYLLLPNHLNVFTKVFNFYVVLLGINILKPLCVREVLCTKLPHNLCVVLT